MSKTVDQRIVEMQLDSDEFERGANKVMGLMDKLKAATDFSNSQSAVNTFSTEHMETAFEKLGKVVVDNMNGIIPMAIRKMKDDVLEVMKSLVKEVESMTSMGQLGAGFSKFGEKTTAVSTLVAQGYEIERVNDLMEQLNWFTDETSYNFTEMVHNIAKFTASGRDLDESVTAMEGIALWAALSGQNASTASRAMYQLSQAMQKGFLKYDDYKSIQNASMDTKEFREQAVAAAEALGVLKKVGEGTWQTLGSSAKDEANLEKAQKKLKDAQDALDDAIDRQASAQRRLNNAYAAQSEATTNAQARARAEAIASSEDAMKRADRSVTKATEKVNEMKAAVLAAEQEMTKGFSLSELFTSKALSQSAWFTSDVMMTVFNNYAKAAKEVQRFQEENHLSTATAAIEELEAAAQKLVDETGIELDAAFKQLGYDIDEFSLKAFKAGQEARTWEDVVNSVKDAVSTGWMNTFELIFGTAKDATKFWTQLANSFYDIFASGGDIRNDILEVAFGYGKAQKDVDKSVAEGASNAQDAEKAWKDFEERIASSGYTMDDFEESCRKVIDATDDMSVDSLVDEYGSLKEAFQQGAITGDIFRKILDDLTGATTSTVDSTVQGVAEAQHSLEELKNVAYGIIRGDYGNGEERRNILEELGYNYDLVQGLAEIIYNGGQGYIGLTEELLRTEYPTFYEMFQGYIAATGVTVAEANEAFEDSDEILNGLQKHVVELTGDVQQDIETIKGTDLFKGGITNLLDAIVNLKEASREAASNVFGDAEEIGAKIYSLLERFNEFSERVKASSENLDGFQNVLENIYRIGQSAFSILGPFANLLGSIGSSFISFGTGAFSGFFQTSTIADTAERVSESIQTFINSLTSFVQSTLPSVEQAGTSFAQFIARIGVFITDTIANLFPGFEGTAVKIREFFANSFGYAAEDGGYYLPRFSEIFSDFHDVLSSIFESFGETFGIEGLETKFESFWTFLTNVGNSLSTTIQSFRYFALAIGEVVSELFSGLFGKNILSDTINKLSSSTLTFSDVLSLFENALNKIAIVSVNVTAAFLKTLPTIKETAYDVGLALRFVVQKIISLVQWLWNIPERLKGVSDKIKQAFSNISNYVDLTPLQEQFDSFKEIFASVRDTILEFLDGKGFGALSNLHFDFSWMKDFLSLGNVIKTVALILIGISGFKLYRSTKIFSATIRSVIVSVTGLLGLASSALKAGSFAAIGIAIATIIGAILLLGNFDAEKLFGAAVGLSIILVVIIKVFKSLTQLETGKLLAGTGSLVLFAMAIGMIAPALALLALFDPMKSIGAVLALSGFLAISIKTLEMLSEFPSMVKLFAGISSILLFSLAIDMLVPALALLALFNPLKVIGAIVGIGALLLVMIKVIQDMQLIPQTGKMLGSVASILMFSVAIDLLAPALAILSLFNPLKVIGAVVAFGALILVMVQAMKMFSEMPNGGKIAGSVATLLLFTVAIDLLAPAMAILALFNPLKLLGSMLALSALLAVMIQAMEMFAEMPNGGKIAGSVATLLLFTVAIDLLVPALGILSLFDPLKVVGAVIGIGLLLAVLITVMKDFEKMPDGNKIIKSVATILLFSVAIDLLAPALAILSFFDFMSLIGAAVALGGLLLVMIAAMDMLADAKTIDHGKLLSIALSFVALGVALDAVALALSLMANIDTTSVITVTACVAALLALMGAFLVFSNKLDSGKMLQTATAMVLCAAAIDLIVAGIAGLAYAFTNLVASGDWSEFAAKAEAMREALKPIEPYLIAIIAAITLLTVVATFAGDKILAFGLGFVGIGAGVLALIYAFSLLPQAIQGIVDAMNVLKENIGTVIEFIVMVIGAVLAVLIASKVGFGKAIVGIAAACAQALTDARTLATFGLALKTLGAFLLTFLIGAMPGLMDKLIDLICTFFESLANAINSSAGRLASAIEKTIVALVNVVLQTFFKIVFDAVGVIGDAFGWLWEKLFGARPDWANFESIVDFGDSVANDIGDAATYIFDSAEADAEKGTEEVIDAVDNTMKDGEDDLVDTASDVADATGTSLVDKLNSVVDDKLVNGSANPLDSIVNMFASKGDDSEDEIATGFGGILEGALDPNNPNGFDVSSVPAEYQDALSGAFGDSSSGFMDIGTMFSGFMGDGAKDSIPDAAKEYSDLTAEQLDEQAKRHEQDFKDIGIYAVEQVKEGYFDEVKYRAPEMAANTVNGLSSAIFNERDSLHALGGLLFQWTKEGYEDAADINSPSKVMEQEMFYTIAGMTRGVQKHGHKAFDAINDIGTDMMNAMRNSMGMLALAVDRDYDLQPRITPVVDLGPAASGARALRTMMNGGQLTQMLDSYRTMDGLAISGSVLNYTNQNAPVTSAIRDLSNRMDSIGNALDQDRNFNVGIRVDHMAVRDEGDIKLISKQLAKEVRVALRQKGR